MEQGSREAGSGQSDEIWVSYDVSIACRLKTQDTVFVLFQVEGTYVATSLVVFDTRDIQY